MPDNTHVILTTDSTRPLLKARDAICDMLADTTTSLNGTLSATMSVSDPKLLRQCLALPAKQILDLAKQCVGENRQIRIYATEKADGPMPVTTEYDRCIRQQYAKIPTRQAAAASR